MELTTLIFLGYAIASFLLAMEENKEERLFVGGSIVISFFFALGVTVVSNFVRNKLFKKLSKDSSSEIKMDVVRNERHQEISIFDIVVGDIVCLKPEDQVPADGLFVEGHPLRVEESSIPGESHYVEVNLEGNTFLVSGSRIAKGSGKMMVTSVGMNTAWGEMKSRISCDTDERTPLQTRLDKFSSWIEKFGLLTGFVVLVVLLVRYFTGNIKDSEENFSYSTMTKSNGFVNALVAMVVAAFTIVVVTISEGFPVAVILTLAYSSLRKMKDQAMVRDLSLCKTLGHTAVQVVRVVVTIIFVVYAKDLPLAVTIFVAFALTTMTDDQAMAERVYIFETMGSATTICTGKTGTLTLNQMEVIDFWLGLESGKAASSSSASQKVVELFHQGAAMNTTGSVVIAEQESKYEFSGSPMEKAILRWAVEELKVDMEKVKGELEVVHVEKFDSEKKISGVLLKKEGEVKNGVHWKGAAEKILAMCSTFYDGSGVLRDIDDVTIKFEEIIKSMAVTSLSCIAFAYSEDNGEMTTKLKEENLSLLGIVGIQDPCRPGVKKDVADCRAAGVNVKMITGDNIFTARAVALECGILPCKDEMNNEVVVEAEEFRNYTQEKRLETVEKIKVMARSSPSDKLLMVKCLKELGQVVAVTGDVINDAPALREADVGLSMGIRGTEEAKEGYHMVILHDDFASVAMVLQWGRCVSNNMQKFIQFHLTANVTAIAINFVAVVSIREVPLTVAQLLWANMVIDTLSAIALAAEKPTNDLMKKKPTGRTGPLITNIMWRNLVAQAFYQIFVLSTLLFVNGTLVFNTYVLCQVFNELNARSLEKKNVLKGIHTNKLFIGIIVVTVFLQVVMVEFLKIYTKAEGLSLAQWGICILIGVGSWPIGWLAKWVPVPLD